MDNKTLLITALKEKYKKLYDAVQPIPYIRDKLFSVNRVFVEGGLEFLALSWVMLDSYHHVFREPMVKSKRRILTGEAGYGKSMLTLQYAYDWCEKVEESYLKDVEILILLRMRQLGKVKSVYKAIRRFILAKGCTLTEKDIKCILDSTSSVVFIFDGFDEYPDAEGDSSTDFMQIITEKMFKSFEVILTSRYLPDQCTRETKLLRLTGFDDKAREEYIKKAVVCGDEDAAKDLTRRLEENPVLGDLCQVPMLFVLFAHMSHENEELKKFVTVTEFFRYMIKSFHHHMKNKMEDENVQKYHTFEDNHRELDKVAFEGLHKKRQQIVWDQETLCNRLGEDFYHQYVRIGILVEEESTTDVLDSPSDRSKKEVRFYHKLFCEWYAAHYLADCVRRKSLQELENLLVHMDPNDLHHCYRFACGLRPASAGNIIKVVKMKEECKHFPAQCIFERRGRIDDVLETVRDICSDEVCLNRNDSDIAQRAVVQLLGISSHCQIPISEVYLHNTYKEVDMSDGICLQLKSNVRFPVLNTLNKLRLREEGREITSKEFDLILKYASKCPALEKVWFGCCLLPRFVQDESVLRSRTFQVLWMPVVNIGRIYVLRFDTGAWQHGGSKMDMKDEDYLNVVIEVRNRTQNQT